MHEHSAASFVMIPGAGGDARYWHRLVDELAPSRPPRHCGRVARRRSDHTTTGSSHLSLSKNELPRERLGITPDTVPGGHLAALSHPGELADLLLA